MSNLYYTAIFSKQFCKHKLLLVNKHAYSTCRNSVLPRRHRYQGWQCETRKDTTLRRGLGARDSEILGNFSRLFKCAGLAFHDVQAQGREQSSGHPALRTLRRRAWSARSLFCLSSLSLLSLLSLQSACICLIHEEAEIARSGGCASLKALPWSGCSVLRPRDQTIIEGWEERRKLTHQ